MVPPKEPQDRRRILAKRGPFALEICACGQLHVSVGFATFRLSPQAGAQLGAILVEGLAKLETSTQGEAPAVTCH